MLCLLFKDRLVIKSIRRSPNGQMAPESAPTKANLAPSEGWVSKNVRVAPNICRAKDVPSLDLFPWCSKQCAWPSLALWGWLGGLVLPFLHYSLGVCGTRVDWIGGPLPGSFSPPGFHMLLLSVLPHNTENGTVTFSSNLWWEYIVHLLVKVGYGKAPFWILKRRVENRNLDVHWAFCPPVYSSTDQTNRKCQWLNKTF